MFVVVATTLMRWLARQRFPYPSRYPRVMDRDEFNQKLSQIEEQAQLTLAEFPKTLTKERQRMIIALVRHLRSECERQGSFPEPRLQNHLQNHLDLGVVGPGEERHRDARFLAPE